MDHVDRVSLLRSAPHGPLLFPPGEWLFDEVHTTIVLSFATLYLRPFRMAFRIRPGGYARVDDAGFLQRVEHSTVTASVDSGSQRRDRVLRGPRFLDVKHFPTVDYHGSASTEQITGVITAKGIPSRVSITATDATLRSDGTLTYAVESVLSRDELGLDHPSSYFVGKRVGMKMRGIAHRA